MHKRSALFYWRYAAVVVLAALLMGIAWYFLRQAPSSISSPLEDSATKAPIAVSLVQPKIIHWDRSFPASGVIAPWKESIISAEGNSLKLLKIMANIGDSVYKGQLLALFDETSTRIELNQYEASLSEAKAYFIEAKVNAQRAHTLRNTGAMSEQDISQLQTKVKITQAQLEAAQARIKAQDLKLKFTRVVAPDDGIISSRSAIEGAVIGSGTELFRLLTKGRLEWRAELTAEQLALITAHPEALLNLPDGSNVRGYVRQLAPVLDSSTQTAIAYIDIIEPNNSLRAGMYVKGVIILGKSPGLAIPGSSLVIRDGYEYVFTVNSQKQAQRIRVQTDRRNQAMVEVVSGLLEYQPVVINGAGFLNEGDPVRVVAPELSTEPHHVTQASEMNEALTIDNEKKLNPTRAILPVLMLADTL